MRCLGRLVAFFLLIGVVIILPCSIWSIAIWEIGTEPTTYTEVLDSEVYERIAPLWLPAFATAVSENNDDARELRVVVHIIQEMDEEEWDRTSAAIVPPQWVEEEMQRNLSGLFSYLHGDTEEIAIVLNTQPVRERLEGSGADLLVQRLMAEVSTWDECSAAQRDDFTAFFNEQTNLVPTCQPGPLMSSRVEDGLYAGVNRLLVELPEDGRFDLRERLIDDGQTTPDEYDMGLQEMRRSVVMTDNSLPIVVLVPIMLMALIVLFAVRTGKEFFLWMGLSLIISAFFSVLPLFSWMYTLTQPIQDATGSDSIETLFLQATLESTRAIAGGLTTPVLVVTFMMVSIGFVFLVLSSILTGPQPQQVQQIYYVPSSSTPPPTPIPQPIQEPSGSTASQSEMPPVEVSVTPPPSKQTPIEQPSETAANPNVASGDTQTFMGDVTFVPIEIEDDDEDDE